MTAYHTGRIVSRCYINVKMNENYSKATEQIYVSEISLTELSTTGEKQSVMCIFLLTIRASRISM